MSVKNKSKKVIYVTSDTHKLVSRFAKAKSYDLGEAVARMAEVAVGRLQALETYAKKLKKGHRPQHRNAA